MDDYRAKALAAFEEWEAMGAPVEAAYLNETAIGREDAAAEEVRASRRAWAKRARDGEAADPSVARNVYRSILADVARARQKEADAARREALAASSRADHELRLAIIDELRDARSALGLTSAEIDSMLGLRPGNFNNLINPRVGNSTRVMRDVLARLQAHVKVSGSKVASTATTEER